MEKSAFLAKRVHKLIFKARSFKVVRYSFERWRLRKENFPGGKEAEDWEIYE